MKIGKILIGIGILVVLIALAYGAASLRNKQQPIVNSQSEIDSQDMVLNADFAHPEGWEKIDYSNAVVFRSPDLKYSCADGTLHTRADIAAGTYADPSDSPCFRAPTATGSEISISNSGDMGLANYTLKDIPDNFTDGNQHNTIRNVKYITVDGTPAVDWEDSYGDSLQNRHTVAIIKDHKIYMIGQVWKYESADPYPAVFESIVSSFKFTS